MDKAALNKLWTVIGTVLLFFTLNAWVHSQGGGFLFNVIHLDDRLVPNAYFAIIIGGAMIGILCLIGTRYAVQVRTDGRRCGLSRLPVTGIDAVDTQTWDGRTYQAFFLVIFVLLPLGSQVHFWKKLYENGHIYSHPQDNPPLAARDWPIKGNLTASALLFGVEGVEHYCIAHRDSWGNPPDANPCNRVKDGDERGGVDWLPIFSPLLLLLATLGAWGSALWLAVELFRTGKQDYMQDIHG